VDQVIKFSFFDDVTDQGLDFRRDYGFVEIYFTGGPGAWVVTGWSLDLHRLCNNPGLVEEWRAATNVEFLPYTAWTELSEALHRIPGSPAIECAEHGDYLQYRVPETKVSVFVMGDPDDERDTWPGHGDVWSVSMP
jgi:hypothetical protein